MYAIIKTGGKQYRVSVGDVVYVEKLNAQEEENVEFDVIAVGKEDGMVVGTPVVEGAKVAGKVIKNGKSKKVTVFTYRSKKDSKRKMGHRQPYTKVEITAINADFVKTGDLLTGFCLTGHAGYDDYGHDIVCASVTSAVQMAANGITEVLKLGAQVDVGENEIKMTLDRADAKKGQAFLQALLLHLNLLSEDYEGTIQVNLSEVYNNA